MQTIEEIKGLPRDESVWVKIVDSVVKYAVSYNKNKGIYSLYIVRNNKATYSGYNAQSPYELNQYIV